MNETFNRWCVSLTILYMKTVNKLTNDKTLTVYDLLDKNTVWYTECFTVLKKQGLEW